MNYSGKWKTILAEADDFLQIVNETTPYVKYDQKH